MSNQPFIRNTLKVAGVFNIIAALAVAFPDTIGSFAQVPPAGTLFHTALLSLLIFIFGIVYFRMAYGQPLDIPLLTLAAFGKTAVFCIALYCYLNAIIPFGAFALAIGDLVFGIIFFAGVIKGRSKE